MGSLPLPVGSSVTEPVVTPDQTIEFDEVVHLAVAAGGFLRTPYLHATSEFGDQWKTPGQHLPLEPQIIHVPAAHRKNALSDAHPPFRRIALSASLVKQISSDRAAQMNQEASGVAFGFHEEAVNNTARALLNGKTRLFGDQMMFLDKILDIGLEPEEINFQRGSCTPTGWMVFLNRYWKDQRHVDLGIVGQHTIPLHFDLDFFLDVILSPRTSPQTTEVVVPVWGAQGAVRAWDARLGEGTFDPVDGAPILGPTGPMDISGGVITVGCDCFGLPYLQITFVDTPTPMIPLVIADASGQFYRRDVHVRTMLSQERFIPLPNGRIGTPYLVRIEEDIELAPTKGVLPDGVDIVDNAIEGVPTEYGANFHAEGTRKSNGELICLNFAVNRWPRTLYTLLDTEGNDHSTGEYYACQFMPYGTMLHYAGTAYEFKRYATLGTPWPRMIEVPYVYGYASRPGALEAEKNWKI